jgi:DNA invertase Pin-like site-specific DNA recombinase
MVILTMVIHDRVVAYYRVSTDKQGKSGLGLEAQQAAVRAYLGREPDRAFTEVESGKKVDRPRLAEALAYCKRHRCKLMIAKLDRLGRRVSFIANLMESGVDFVAADSPNDDRFMLHIKAAVAEDEARKISERTKAALAALKARGVALGGHRHLRKDGTVNTPPGFSGACLEASREVRVANADYRAASYEDTIRSLQARGVTSLNGLASELNAMGVLTPRGRRFYPATVKNMLARL